MAEQEIIKHTKAIVELSTDRKKPWRHRVKDFIGEILIIMFAVSMLGLKAVDYFGRVGAGMPLNMDSLDPYAGVFFGNIQISPRVSRFEALKGSGRLDIIRNKELLVHITDLYTKDFPQIIRVNEYFDKLRGESFFPFVADHLQMDAAGNGTNWQEILRTPKMRLLMHMGKEATASVEDYTTGIDKCQLILGEIDKQLK
jgi:hypothetical protein